MAKKFVRGVTGIEDIESYDKTLTNVNDILSDGENTYVHTKKGKNEFYYNITSAINQLQSTDNTLTITKDNDTVSISNNGLATKEELAQKQNTLTNNTSIGVVGTGLRQLYMSKNNFPATGALLKTYVKSISGNTSVEVAEEEFNFIIKFNKNITKATFTINTPTASRFSNIITAYGEDNALIINGCLFTLNDRTLTVSRTLDTDENYVITFSNII